MNSSEILLPEGTVLFQQWTDHWQFDHTTFLVERPPAQHAILTSSTGESFTLVFPYTVFQIDLKFARKKQTASRMSMAAYLNPKSITETYQKVHESGIADFLNGFVHAFTYVPERQKGGHFWKPAPSVRITAQTAQEIVTAAISKYWQTRFDTSLSRGIFRVFWTTHHRGSARASRIYLERIVWFSGKAEFHFSFVCRLCRAANEM